MRYMDDRIGQVLAVLQRAGGAGGDGDRRLRRPRRAVRRVGRLRRPLHGGERGADTVPLVVAWPGVVTAPGRRGLRRPGLQRRPGADAVRAARAAAAGRAGTGPRSPASCAARRRRTGGRYVVYSHGLYSCQRVVRTHRWQLTRTYHPGAFLARAGACCTTWPHDPYQTTNLAARHPEVVAELDHLLAAVAERAARAPRGGRRPVAAGGGDGAVEVRHPRLLAAAPGGLGAAGDGGRRPGAPRPRPAGLTRRRPLPGAAPPAPRPAGCSRHSWLCSAAAPGRRNRPQPHPRQPRPPLRPVVEPGGGGPGHRPRLPHRPEVAGGEHVDELLEQRVTGQELLERRRSPWRSCSPAATGRRRRGQRGHSGDAHSATACGPLRGSGARPRTPGGSATARPEVPPGTPRASAARTPASGRRSRRRRGP